MDIDSWLARVRAAPVPCTTMRDEGRDGTVRDLAGVPVCWPCVPATRVLQLRSARPRTESRPRGTNTRRLGFSAALNTRTFFHPADGKVRCYFELPEGLAEPLRRSVAHFDVASYTANMMAPLGALLRARCIAPRHSPFQPASRIVAFVT